MKSARALLRVWIRLRRPDELAVVARGAGRSVMAQAAGLGLGYAVHVLLARWMGAADYGVYTYVLAWATLLAVPAGAGLPILVVRFIPEYTVRRQWGLLRGVLGWGLALVVAVGAGIALAVDGGVAMLGPAAFAPYGGALLLGIWMVPLQASSNVVSGIYEGFHRVGRAHSLPTLRHGLVLALVVAVWWGSGALTSTSALTATLAALLGLLVLQVRPLLRTLPAAARTATPAYAPRTWLRVGLPLLLVSGFLLLIAQADVLMVGSLLGSRAAGLYWAASKTAALVGVVYVAAVAAAGPMMARLHARGAHDRMRRLAAMVAHGIFWPSALLVLVLSLAADPVLRLFGPDFPEARWVLVALMMGQLANAAGGLGATTLNLTGHHDWGAAVFGWSALLNVALNAVGVVWLGLEGAALATAVTMAVQSLAFCLLARRRLGLDPSIFAALRHRPQGQA